MSTYVALLDGGGREETIGVRQIQPGKYEVAIGNRVCTVDVLDTDGGTISLLADTESFSVGLDRRGGEVKVSVRDSLFSLEILEAGQLRRRRIVGAGKP